MGTKVFNNKRPNDTNIHRNNVVLPTGQEFTLPSDTVRTREERDAVIAALQVFRAVTNTGLRLQGRDLASDEQLLVAADRVLHRLA
jgi:hypothetical protein